MKHLKRVIAQLGKTVRIPGSLFEELWALEVETFQSEPGEVDWEEQAAIYPDRAAFIEAMHNAEHRGRSVMLPLDDVALEYLKSPNGPIYNSIDIWNDKAEGGGETGRRARYFLKSVQKVIEQL